MRDSICSVGFSRGEAWETSLSEIEPHGSVGEDTCEGEVFPHGGVGFVSLRWNLPFSQLLSCRCSRQNLPSVRVLIDLHNHELACLVKVLELSDGWDVKRLHRVEEVARWCVRLVVFGLSITSVEESDNLTRSSSVVVKFDASQVIRNPTSVDKNAAFFPFFIEMGVERSHNVAALLSVPFLINLNFFLMVKNASNFDLLEREIVFEIFNACIWFAPQKSTSSICWSDVNCRLSQKLFSIINNWHCPSYLLSVSWILSWALLCWYSQACWVKTSKNVIP